MSTQADTLFLSQSFSGWHFLGLLSLLELFTPPLSFTVCSTDLMGRERERERVRVTGHRESVRERHREREAQRECNQAAIGQRQ